MDDTVDKSVAEYMDNEVNKAVEKTVDQAVDNLVPDVQSVDKNAVERHLSMLSPGGRKLCQGDPVPRVAANASQVAHGSDESK